MISPTEMERILAALEKAAAQLESLQADISKALRAIEGMQQQVDEERERIEHAREDQRRMVDRVAELARERLSSASASIFVKDPERQRLVLNVSPAAGEETAGRGPAETNGSERATARLELGSPGTAKSEAALAQFRKLAEAVPQEDRAGTEQLPAAGPAERLPWWRRLWHWLIGRR